MGRHRLQESQTELRLIMVGERRLVQSTHPGCVGGRGRVPPDVGGGLVGLSMEEREGTRTRVRNARMIYKQGMKDNLILQAFSPWCRRWGFVGGGLVGGGLVGGGLVGGGLVGLLIESKKERERG